MRGTLESAATRRVGACPDGFRISLSNSSNSKSLARARAFRGAAEAGPPGPPKSVQKSTKNLSKFGCHFGVVFDASWVPFGLPFGPSWPPKSAQVQTKMPLERLSS